MSDGRKILILIDIAIKTFPIPFLIANILYLTLTVIEFYNTKYMKLSQIWFDNYFVLIEMSLMFWVSYFIWVIISEYFENF